MLKLIINLSGGQFLWEVTPPPVMLKKYSIYKESSNRVVQAINRQNRSRHLAFADVQELKEKSPDTRNTRSLALKKHKCAIFHACLRVPDSHEILFSARESTNFIILT
jgi:uncharacterized membrane protein